MIRLVFTANREIFIIEISGREIWYSDRKSGRKKLMPGGKLSPQEQDEYEEAQTEEDLANNCIKDAKKTGAILLKREKL